MEGVVLPAARARGLSRRHLENALLPLAVAAILAGATLLRLWDLGARSLWFDEAFSVQVARQSVGEILRLLRTGDPHPPLHYMLLHAAIRAFGTSEFAVRLPSALAGVGSVLLTFLLARRLAGTGVAVLATLLLALSPFHITSAREARMYPFLTLFALGSMYALWLALEEGKPRQWIAYIATTLLALLSHHFAFFLLPAQAVVAAAPGRSPQATRRWFWALLLIAALYLPYVPLLVSQIGIAWNWPAIRPPFGIRAESDLLGLLSFGGGSYGMGGYFHRGFLPLGQRLSLLLPFLILPAAGVAALRGWRERLFLLGYWLVPIVTNSIISLHWNIFYERYFSFVLPPFVILMATGALAAGRAWPRISRFATAGILIVLTAFTLPALRHVYQGPWPYNWRAAAQHVTERGRPQDVILFVPSFGRIPFDYYFQGGHARASLLTRRAPGGKLSLGDPATTQVQLGERPVRIAVLAQQHQRLWVVVTIPLGYEARQEVSRVLARYFREVEGRDFGLVFTSLWESRRDPGADGP